MEDAGLRSQGVGILLVDPGPSAPDRKSDGFGTQSRPEGDPGLWVRQEVTRGAKEAVTCEASAWRTKQSKGRSSAERIVLCLVARAE